MSTSSALRQSSVRWVQRAARIGGSLVLRIAIALAACLVISIAMVALQAGRDERRSADAALLIASDQQPVLVEQAFDLYRRGTVTQIVVAGERQIADGLLARGLPPEAVLTIEHLPSQGWGRLAEQIAAANIRSLLVLDRQELLLRDLKALRDHGLQPFGVPSQTAQPDLIRLTEGGLAYWAYLFNPQ